MSNEATTKILQLAVSIEEKGENFYKAMAGYARDERQKELFLYLATEEEKHKDIFNYMIENLKKGEQGEEFPHDYFNYLQDYYENSVFDPGCREELLVIKSDFQQALNLAIRKELESIVFYEELKQFIEMEQHAVIDRIIKEERQHFIKLSEVKKLLCYTGEKDSRQANIN